MTDRDRAQYSQLNPQQQRYDNVVAGGGQSGYPHVYPHQKGPSTGQVLAVVTLLPVGGVLLGLAGITLVGTLIGLAVATPLFVICSPVVVPAAIMLAGAVTGILTSGVFGLTGLSSLSWVVNSFRRCTGEDPLEYAKRRMHEATVQVGEKTKQMGEAVGEKTKQAGETVKTKSEGGGGGANTGGRT